jgi:hypothetical protein
MLIISSTYIADISLGLACSIKMKRRPLQFEGEGLLFHPHKVNISALHIRADQLDSESIADVQTFKSALQSAFNRRIHQTNLRSLIRCTSHNGIKLRSDSGFQQHRGGGFFDAPFDLLHGIFYYRAVRGERR